MKNSFIDWLKAMFELVVVMTVTNGSFVMMVVATICTGCTLYCLMHAIDGIASIWCVGAAFIAFQYLFFGFAWGIVFVDAEGRNRMHTIWNEKTLLQMFRSCYAEMAAEIRNPRQGCYH